MPRARQKLHRTTRPAVPRARTGRPPLRPARAGELREIMRKARNAADFLKALAHESRLVILCLLSEREHTVGELEDALALGQATVSQQLARLRHEGLVATRREGRTIIYSLADDTTRRFIGAIYEKFCRT